MKYALLNWIKMILNEVCLMLLLFVTPLASEFSKAIGSRRSTGKSKIYFSKPYRRQQFTGYTMASSSSEEVINFTTTSQVTVSTKKPLRTKRTTTVTKSQLGNRFTSQETCDVLAKNCLLMYITSKVCGRTIFYNYATFDNYCMLDYVNCVEKYEVWMVVHMGPCFSLHVPYSGYAYYPYDANIDRYDRTLNKHTYVRQDSKEWPDTIAPSYVVWWNPWTWHYG